MLMHVSYCSILYGRVRINIYGIWDDNVIKVNFILGFLCIIKQAFSLYTTLAVDPCSMANWLSDKILRVIKVFCACLYGKCSQFDNVISHV